MLSAQIQQRDPATLHFNHKFSMAIEIASQKNSFYLFLEKIHKNFGHSDWQKPQTTSKYKKNI